jgi:adenine-specific DNA methylase
MTRKQIEIELAKARKSYAECGCKIYKERINELTAKLKSL